MSPAGRAGLTRDASPEAGCQVGPDLGDALALAVEAHGGVHGPEAVAEQAGHDEAGRVGRRHGKRLGHAVLLHQALQGQLARLPVDALMGRLDYGERASLNEDSAR